MPCLGSSSSVPLAGTALLERVVVKIFPYPTDGVPLLQYPSLCLKPRTSSPGKHTLVSDSSNGGSRFYDIDYLLHSIMIDLL